MEQQSRAGGDDARRQLRSIKKLAFIAGFKDKSKINPPSYQ
jgi:hypothetical protein